jgi:hypothetical protein
LRADQVQLGKRSVPSNHGFLTQCARDFTSQERNVVHISALFPDSKSKQGNNIMKPAMIVLAAALVVAGPSAFAQSGGGSAGGGSAGGPAASTVTTGSTTGGSAGSSTTGTGTGGINNGAGSISAGRNSAQNPSGNSYINPPPGTATNPR